MKNNALSYPITLCRKIRDSYQKSNVNVMNCIGYTFIILLIHLLTYGISWKAIYIINKVTDYIPSYTSYINAITNAGQRSLSASVLIFIPFLLGIPLVLTCLFFRDAGAQQYTKTDDKHFWLKSTLMYVIPGEFVRFILCIIPVNVQLAIPQTVFGNLFGIPSRILFELIYALPADRLTDIRMYQFSSVDLGGQLIFPDYLAYSALHIITSAFYIGVFLLIYRRSWKKGADEYEKIYSKQEDIELPFHKNTPVSRELDKLESRSPQIKEIVINSFTVFLCSTAVGLASNAFILLAGWLFTLPAFDYGLANLSDQFLWALWAAIGMAVCMIGLYPCGKFIGEQAAQFRIGYKLSPQLNTSAMIASVLMGLAVHGIICVLLSYSSPADCFIAGPVQYLSRFIGHGERSLFIHDSFDYPRLYTYMAIGIYLALIGITLCSGYARGHRNRPVFVAEKERTMSENTVD